MLLVTFNVWKKYGFANFFAKSASIKLCNERKNDTFSNVSRINYIRHTQDFIYKHVPKSVKIKKGHKQNIVDELWQNYIIWMKGEFMNKLKKWFYKSFFSVHQISLIAQHSWSYFLSPYGWLYQYRVLCWCGFHSKVLWILSTYWSMFIRVDSRHREVPKKHLPH